MPYGAQAPEPEETTCRPPQSPSWLLDAGRGRLLLRHASGAYESLQELHAEGVHRPKIDSRTRVYASAGGSRSAVEAKTPAKLKARAAFAGELAEAIEQGLSRELFDQFLVCAPSPVLKAVVERLGPMARSKLMGEAAKDLTKAPEAELRERLDQLAAEARLSQKPQ